MISNPFTILSKPGVVLSLRRVEWVILILISLIITAPVQAQEPQVATWYHYPDTVTRSGYWYNEITVPFVAVDAGQVNLLHHIVTGSANGVRFRAAILDTGHLAGYCVEQSTGCYPIALDMSKAMYEELGLVGLSSVLDWWDVDMSTWWGKL